jgi:hypothetical protein
MLLIIISAQNHQRHPDFRIKEFTRTFIGYFFLHGKVAVGLKESTRRSALRGFIVDLAHESELNIWNN